MDAGCGRYLALAGESSRLADPVERGPVSTARGGAIRIQEVSHITTEEGGRAQECGTKYELMCLKFHA